MPPAHNFLIYSSIIILLHVSAKLCGYQQEILRRKLYIYIYRVSQEEWTKLRESVLTAVTHLLITKYILKLPGICGFCNVNICT